MPTYLVNLLELVVLILPFSFLTSPIEVNIFPTYVKEELLVRGQFHQFLGLFAKFQFTNFNLNESLFWISNWIFQKCKKALYLKEDTFTSYMIGKHVY